MSGAKEIGGYFEFERFSGRSYHEGAIALNCGRACLSYLIELRDIETIWLPDFLCNSVVDLCNRVGAMVRTYRIGDDLLPVRDFAVGAGEWLYLVDYYGQITSEAVDEARDASGGRLIVDESQGFFREPWEHADTLYTCRKWFGVADGAYLYTKDGARLSRTLPIDESFARMNFVLGRYERSAGEFFAESKENNARFSRMPAMAMSPITSNILRAIDYSDVMRRRTENYAYVHDRLKDLNLLRLNPPQGAFMYPFQTERCEEARNRLAREGVFVPVLWPNVLDERSCDTAAFRFAHTVLPLPIDQRYSIEHMKRIVRAIEP